jgi:putative membrane protein
LAFVVLSQQPLRLALAPRALRRAQVHRAAAEQFLTRHVNRTGNRSGVLIYISLGERSMRIMADDAVNERIARHEWQAIVEAVIMELRAEKLAEGLVIAIDRCAALLAERLPDDGGTRNDLPDRVYLI